MDLTEIDAKIAELQALRAKAESEAAERKAKEDLAEATELLGTLAAQLHRLMELRYLPPRLKDALTDNQGKFNPGVYIKRPRLKSED